MIRTGIGYDLHSLVEGRKLFIGGIEIPYTKGLSGHSDADVMLHAICDSLLGAIAEGDIGEHFPDTDPKYKDISSARLLDSVSSLVKKKGYCICNIDTVIIAQEPNLKPYKKIMQERIAGILKIDRDCISIKAKTNEGIGEIGKGEAIACFAVSLLNKSSLSE